MAQNNEDVERILSEARTAELRGSLTIEPYFIGTLYSIESLSWEGETIILALSSRILSPEPDFMEEAVSAPVQLPKPKMKRLTEWITQVLYTVGYTRGFAHTEFIVTHDGFEVIEINPRLGGTQTGEALCQIYHCNIYEAFIDMSLGKRPNLLDVELVPKHGAAMILVYARVPGQFQRVMGLERLAMHPGNPAFYPVANTGKIIEHLKDQRACVGILMASGESSEIALLNALSAHTKLKVLMCEEGSTRG